MSSICFLCQATQQWLVRHKAHLVGDQPRLLLERLKGGDFLEQGYDYVIVDELQDPTSGEQELMFRLRRRGGRWSLSAIRANRSTSFAGTIPKASRRSKPS